MRSQGHRRPAWNMRRGRKRTGRWTEGGVDVAAALEGAGQEAPLPGPPQRTSGPASWREGPWLLLPLFHIVSQTRSKSQ